MHSVTICDEEAGRLYILFRLHICSAIHQQFVRPTNSDAAFANDGFNWPEYVLPVVCRAERISNGHGLSVTSRVYMRVFFSEVGYQLMSSNCTALVCGGMGGYGGPVTRNLE